MKTFVKILLAVALACAFFGSPFLFLKDEARAIVASASLLLLVVGLAPFGVAGAWLLHHRRIARASRALDRAALVRGPFGAVTHARGSLDGEPMVISRAGVALDGETRALLLAPRVLRRLAFDRERLVIALRAAIAEHRSRKLLRGASAGAKCPYCKDTLAPREPEGSIRCPACESLHHTACWQEHGGCSVHGCSRVRARDTRDPERA